MILYYMYMNRFMFIWIKIEYETEIFVNLWHKFKFKVLTAKVRFRNYNQRKIKLKFFNRKVCFFLTHSTYRIHTFFIVHCSLFIVHCQLLIVNYNIFPLWSCSIGKIRSQSSPQTILPFSILKHLNRFSSKEVSINCFAKVI